MRPDLPEPPSFEDSLRELEETVERLEAGALPLEESLALFEKGVGSLKRCHAILDQAEKRVQVLVRRPDGTPDLRDAAPAGNPPQRSVAPIPARKKSAKLSIDAEQPQRQNAAPCTEPALESGRAEPSSLEQNEKEGGLGGSLFGVAQ